MATVYVTMGFNTDYGKEKLEAHITDEVADGETSQEALQRLHSQVAEFIGVEADPTIKFLEGAKVKSKRSIK